MFATLANQCRTYANLVALPHSVFALPFALSMLVLLGRTYPISGLQLFAIVVAVVCARTAAMAWNRLTDREIDSLNPRTKDRELPQKKVTLQEVWTIIIIASIGFFCCAALLGTHCLVLAPIVLGILLFYSWTKRFTSWAHFFLGLALALAPGGVWYAITAEWSLVPIPLMLGVLLWVSGFDVLYSCQDYTFDKTEELFSIPSRFGIGKALRLALWLHLGAIVCLFVFGIAMQCGFWYYLGVFVFGLVLLSQHRLVSENNLSQINKAFFTRNGIASVLFFLIVCLDAMTR